MIELPASPPTIRQRIMTVFLDRFSNMRRGVDGAALTWDVVTDKNMTSEEQSAGYSLGIYDTSEKKRDEIGKVKCFLNVVFEFRIRLAEGDDPTAVLRAVMGEVQRVAMSDLNCREPDGYQLSLDVQEKGNELENMATAPTHVAGVVVCEVHYQHRPGKPWLR